MDQFGRYTVFECLGAGGMATVHRATIEIGGGVIREVALKRMLPQLVDDKKTLDDFIREAKLAAQLNHPNIVRILELGRNGTIYFIAMELVRGHSLLQLMKLMVVRRETVPIGIVVALLSELCDALDYASSATDAEGQPMEIVHRDLSPSNLIVDTEGHLKIIDFGVAKSTRGQFVTSSGLVKGKLGYMALEVLAGKEIDRRSDIFSVGVVAWEMLTGRRLFSAANEYDVITNTPTLVGTLFHPTLVPAAEAWGLGTDPWGPTSMPWILIVDGSGVVRAKYQGIIGTADVDVMLSLVAAGG